MSMTSASTVLLWVISIVAIVFFHTWQLLEVPQGLYVDETSIGLNAALIADAGRDEHGEPWPVFFKAFGEYKNPLYIYSVAAMYRLGGVSSLGLRLTSALWYFFFLASLAFLVQRHFLRPSLTLLTLVLAGFLPWFFPLSRISFEVVAQLGLLTMWLLFLHLAYVRPRLAPGTAFVAGVFLGSTIYACSASRLLAVLFLGLWLVTLTKRFTWRQAIAGVSGFGLTFIPYVSFALTHPGALTKRFHVVSYVYNPALSVSQKIGEFASMYLQHFSPRFLLMTGDSNLRHATGFGGALSATCFVLAVLGLAWIVYHRRWRTDVVARLLPFLILLAPTAAALTTGDSGQVLRAAPLGIFFVLLAAYGAYALFLHPARPVILCLLLLFVAIEAGSYLTDYFGPYQAKSRVWFETYGFPEALVFAAGQEPQQIIVSPHGHQAATNLAYYQRALPAVQTVPLVLGEPVPQPGACVVYFPNDAPVVNQSTLPFTQRADPQASAHVRCYKLLLNTPS